MDQEEYPCAICKELCESHCIECSICTSWVHTACVPLTETLLVQWSADPHSNFVCTNCVFISRRNGEKSFNFLYALNRISLAAGNIQEQQRRADEIRMLLATYGVNLPPFVDTYFGPLCTVSNNLLKLFHPISLHDYRPISTIGDGNCLYRAVSMMLFGSQAHHLELRVRTALEILMYPVHYDNALANYVDAINDVFVVTSDYTNLIRSTVTYGSYSELLHMYALSAATGVTLQSYYPPTDPLNNYARAFTRSVIGRCSRPFTSRELIVMWTQISALRRGSKFQPNHFVPLQRLSQEPVLNGQYISDEDEDSDCGVTDDQYEDDQDVQAVHEDTSSTTVNHDQHVTQEECLDNQEESPMCKIDGPAMGNLLNNTFLTAKDVAGLLTETDSSLSSIPVGHKNNVYFLVDNTSNRERRANGEPSQFWDDCGSWGGTGSSSPKTFFLLESSKLTNVTIRNGLVCKERQINRKKVFTPIVPQPDQSNLLILQRLYSTLKESSSYKRRITWIENLPPIFSKQLDLALVEYVGTFPGRTPHGNAKKSSMPYRRTKPEVITKLKEMVNHTGPRNTYDQIQHNTEDSLLHPRSMEQVKNTRKRVMKKMQEGGSCCTGNFADNVLSVMSMAQDHDFIQSIIHTKNKVPSIICYTNSQILDIKRLCAKRNGQVLGFDKTFNLGDVFVTASVFKHTAVTKHGTDEHPIFLGPIFLHGNSDFQTYSSFFSHLSSQLTDEEIAHIVFGTDDETPMRKAIQRNFPSSYNVVCVRHLKNNVKDYLAKHVPSSATLRKDIVSTIFGENGITASEDTDVLQYRTHAAINLWTEEAPLFVDYFRNRLLPILNENVCIPQQVRDMDNKWTNNNCESINHVLKVKTNWRQLKLTDLVLTIYEHVDARYKDLQRSLHGEGSFRLTENFRHHQINADVWYQRTQDGRTSAFSRFMRDSGKQSASRVTARDGSLTVPIRASKSRKPTQRKRSRAERTTTTKKGKF